jgi:phosphatidylserine/phosphatidylglycerophosphate/cardiolipin synthase-like enzyme
MSHPLRALGRTALEGLADALQSGRIGGPVARSSLVAHVPDDHVDTVFRFLADLETDGMAPRHIAATLKLVAEERAAAQRMSDRVQLVWTPAEHDHVDARDTSVVVQELFRLATRSVLITTFALDAGKKAETLFGDLAARMDASPDLSVHVLVNIHRKHKDTTPSPVLVREFARRLRANVWPGERLPEVFYDPRSLEIDAPKKAALHAKCIVVDGRWSLLTSANFTEAAQERNIEAGVVVDDRQFAERIERQFGLLVERGALKRLALGAR